MNALQSVTLPATTLLELAAHLRASEAPFDVDEATRRAVCAWLAAEKGGADKASGPLRGYQWKGLFLPEGTVLRMTFGAATSYATVVGEHILYQGRQVSPRQFTMALAGDGHNAWRNVWLQFPGEKTWRLACTLRQALTELAGRTPPSPFEAFSHAADDMRKAMLSTLQLLDKAAAAHAGKLDRRLDKHRRATDFVDGDVPFDGV